MGGFIKHMNIPTYIIENAVRHFERIALKCKAPPLDTRTANALRLARRDLVAIKKHMDKYKQK